MSGVSTNTTVSVDTHGVRMDAVWVDRDTVRVVVVEKPTSDDAGATVAFEVPADWWAHFTHAVKDARPAQEVDARRAG